MADEGEADRPLVLGIVGRRQLLTQEQEAEQAIARLSSEEEKAQLQLLLQQQKARDQKFFEFLVELRNLEIKYEELYQPFYRGRVAALHGRTGFWLQVLKNNAFTDKFIQVKDEEVLNYLVDVRSVDDPTCDNYAIEFEFAENPFFSESVLRKSFAHDEDQVLDEAIGTKISWKKGKDITVESKKQKVKGKTVSVAMIQQSFFRFFSSSSAASDEEEMAKFGAYLAELGHKDVDEELGVELRDEIVPHALFYYLGVRTRALKEEKEESLEDEAGATQEEEKSPSTHK